MSALRSTWFTIALAWLIVIAIASTKIGNAQAARYTSDIVDFHGSLLRAVSGEGFRSYVYGSALGDHGYPILALFAIPYAWLQERGIWLLVMIAPVATASVASVLAVATASAQTLVRTAAPWILISFPASWWLLIEPTYGFHPDTLAYPLLFASLVFLDPRWTMRRTIGLISIGLVALLKEETGILSIFFAIPFILSRSDRRLGLKILGIGGASSVLSFAVTAVAQTPFNRTNRQLMTERLVASGDHFLPQLSPYQWVAFGCGLALIGGLIVASRRLNPPVIVKSAVLVLAAKLVFLVLVPNPVRASWHTAAVLAPLAFLTFEAWRWRPHPIIRPIIVAIVVLGALLGGKFLMSEVAQNESSQQATAMAVEAYELFSPLVGDEVVSVPLGDWFIWRDQRSTPYPRGVSMSPENIASYAVMASDQPVPRCFVEITRTKARSMYSIGEC